MGRKKRIEVTRHGLGRLDLDSHLSLGRCVRGVDVLRFAIGKEVKGGCDCMNEKISIEFTGSEFDKIVQYMESVDATTVQNAIMNAISIALDEQDGE